MKFVSKQLAILSSFGVGVVAGAQTFIQFNEEIAKFTCCQSPLFSMEGKKSFDISSNFS